MANGSNRPTMQDVADRVGVSKATVSLVFRKAPGVGDKTREDVLAAAEALGYRMNRAAALMTARRSHLLGVVVQIRNSFHAEIVESIVSAADLVGYETVLGAVTPTHDESRVIETLIDFRCEGMLLIGPELDAKDIVELGERLPTVVVGRRMSSPLVDVVRANDARGIGTVVDHLVDLGHRRIVHVAAGPGVIASDRRAGFLRAMQRHQLDAHDAVIDAGGYTEEAGMAAARRLLGSEMPTGIVCANDRLAVGILDMVRRAGLDVPGDVSITGYDDSALARLANVDLTSVSQQPTEQADRAVAAVVDRLDTRRNERTSTVLVPRLVVRSSTGPA
ncbi:LacI family DNA-binding transcriptional regulator [Gordonia sp. HNM0687]|uniref:LacI family DNA-binding transcriptional regulator n=2 Tax=Gordonia mangrovi TaxID=2665643 RepID=A0A6L7GSW5_9ACTN|nr:LacI family DNA-binding transcriptional regulator [Gordonia mangrovi]MXP21755.1 LacI family DNA-binding transcriptional regulator [Gordonia mangrovi]UVF80484.1 LacI family transcriptional regulator [Gordonia mangrovi]